jgi:S-DNA-T family DNA segregation ATPase FtsK/SpoIIIE
MAGLAHVGSVAPRRDVNRVRRTVAELYALLHDREAQFAAVGVDGMPTYRRAKHNGHYSADPYGDVFLVVDGWMTLRSEFEDLEPMVAELANRGLGYGIHLVVTCNRWMDMRGNQRDMYGTKIELRLGDSADSAINRREAANVPERAPGRGLTTDGLHFLTGLPRVDGQSRVDDLADAVTDLVKLIAADWTHAPAPAVRLLPAELAASALPVPTPGRGGKLPIGIAETDLQPVYLDFDAEPHVLLLGDIECGKSSFLRGLARSITQAYTPEQARVILVDQRRSLLGCIDTPHLIGYGTSAQVTSDMVAQVVTVMAERLPGPDVRAEQLRARSWWHGPELFMLVDDYDLVAGGSVNPLLPLLEYLTQARDLGLHLMLTRRIGGASRAMFDPIIARIRELASPGIMMSGPRDEGPLFGAIKPQLLPPGRAWLITRRHGSQLVQLAWNPPAV